MKALKVVLIGLAVLLVLLLVTGLFTQKDYAVERSIAINRPKAEVFNYVKYLKNQDNYSVWAKIDPAMKKEYKGTDGTIGFVSAWDSENSDAGKGEQEIKGITEGARVDYELRFIEPFEARDHAYMTTEATAANQTTVKWGFKGRIDYPKNVMLLFMNMEKILGDQLQTGLGNLKTTLEQQPAPISGK